MLWGGSGGVGGGDAGGRGPPWPPRVTRGGGVWGGSAVLWGSFACAGGVRGFVCIIWGGSRGRFACGGRAREGRPIKGAVRGCPSPSAPARSEGSGARGAERRSRRGKVPEGEAPGAWRPQGSEAPASAPQVPAEPRHPPPPVPPKKLKTTKKKKKKTLTSPPPPQPHPQPQHESHQPGEVREELLRGRVLPLGAEPGHRPRQQQQEPGAGGTHEPPVRHERLLLQAARAGAGHPAGHQGEPGGDPPARHRLHLRPADRAGGGGQGARPVLGGHPAVPQGGRAGLRALLQRRERAVPLTPPPAVPISKHAASVGS